MDMSEDMCDVVVAFADHRIRRGPFVGRVSNP